MLGTALGRHTNLHGAFAPASAPTVVETLTSRWRHARRGEAEEARAAVLKRCELLFMHRRDVSERWQALKCCSITAASHIAAISVRS